MDARRGPDTDLRQRAPGPSGDRIRENVGPIETGTHPVNPVQDTTSPHPPVRRAVPAVPGHRPWVGPKFFGGLAVAVPISILLWAGIIWLVIRLFFS